MSNFYPQSGPERASGGPDVNYPIHLEQILDANRRAPLDANFLYRQSDPYAVEIVFHHEPGSILWAVGRELLINGMYEPAGEGDVTISPDLDKDGKALVNIALWPPSEADAVILTAPTRDIALFLDLTLDLVPQGFEFQAYENASIEHFTGKLS